MSGPKNKSRFDPYKNFKFRVSFDGRYVAGVSKAIPKATRNDLGFSNYKLGLLGQIVKHAESIRTLRAKSGRGTTALLVGAEGTGKTLAAEVIANELGSHLYRVDLSKIVSKYIGETEKNIDRVFDAAEKSAAVLYFDEADALFGKRSDVKDAHDRYANLEVSYLLKRMRAHNGVVLLATNLKQDIDAAFLRRLRFVINFPS
jgi:SpoVK/Ycf46/Vps4 family AAA+-type ATPase